MGTHLIANRKLKPRLGPPDVYPQVKLALPTVIFIVIITNIIMTNISHYH